MKICENHFTLKMFYTQSNEALVLLSHLLGAVLGDLAKNMLEDFSFWRSSGSNVMQVVYWKLSIIIIIFLKI